MRVSVVIPTYNRRSHLLRAIESVRAQSVPVGEIIVVDDGSTDGTAEAVAGRFGTAVILIRTENGGVSAARNRGIAIAQGEWIAFLDSDDTWLPNKLELQFESLSTFSGGAGLCFSNNSYGNNPNMLFSRFDEVGFTDAPRYGVLTDVRKTIHTFREPFFTSSLLIRRALLTECGGFDEKLILREDTDLVFRLSFKTPFCFVSTVLVEIDRTPQRSLGLCELYGTRDDRVCACSEHAYRKWLAMPEVVGSEDEAHIMNQLRLVYYDSIEAKVHQLRISSAFHEMGKLRRLGESYPAIAASLWSRKLKKLRRRFITPEARIPKDSNQPRADLA